MNTKNDSNSISNMMPSSKRTLQQSKTEYSSDFSSNVMINTNNNTILSLLNADNSRYSNIIPNQKNQNLKTSVNSVPDGIGLTNPTEEKGLIVGSTHSNNQMTFKISMNTINKRLSIDTNEDDTTKCNLKNVGALSATNNSGASIYGLTKNSLTSGAKGGLTTKNSTQTFDLRKIPYNLLPSGNTNSKISPARQISGIGTNANLLANNSHVQTPTNVTYKTHNFKPITINTTTTTTNNNNNAVLTPVANNSSAGNLTNATLVNNNSNIMKNNSSHNTVNENQGQSNTGESQQPPHTPSRKMTPIPNHEPTKCSVKRNGIVKAYAANTNQGIVRNYNEDRVSIILNIMKPANRALENWPKCSFFGIYDGHGGVMCADFLRDNLHQFVIKEPSFPSNPKEALAKGFEAAEKKFFELAEHTSTGETDRSGSCAVVVLIVGDMCFVANVGDSRAIMSGDAGNRIFPLSRDHKPIDECEQKRIIEAGGKIYQTQAPAIKTEAATGRPQMQFLLGPYRVLPGRLSVSRTFGDIEAKLPKYGGNPNVVIAIPEIKCFKIAPEHDFIILASDGIYDKLSTKEVIRAAWESTEIERAPNIHQQCGLAVDQILREAINRRTLDNITVVIIGFKNFKETLFPRRITSGIDSDVNRNIGVGNNNNNNNELDMSNLGIPKGLPPTAKNSGKSKLSSSRNLANKENDNKDDQIQPEIQPFTYHENLPRRNSSKNGKNESEENQLSSLFKSNDSKEEISKIIQAPLTEITLNPKNQVRNNSSVGHVNNMNNHSRQRSDLKHGTIDNKKPKSLDKFDMKLIEGLTKQVKQRKIRVIVDR